MDTPVNRDEVIQALSRRNSAAEKMVIPARSVEVVRRELIDYVKQQMTHRQIFAFPTGQASTASAPSDRDQQEGVAFTQATPPDEFDRQLGRAGEQATRNTDATAPDSTADDGKEEALQRQVGTPPDEFALPLQPPDESPHQEETMEVDEAESQPCQIEYVNALFAVPMEQSGDKPAERERVSPEPELPEEVDEPAASSTSQQIFAADGERGEQDGKEDAVIDISDDDEPANPQRAVADEIGQLLRDAGVVSRTAAGEKLETMGRRVSMRPTEQAQRVCTVRVIEHNPRREEPKVVWYNFDRNSRRIYAYWDWPKEDGVADFAVVTIDRFAVELSSEMDKLPKEERHYTGARLKFLSVQREFIEPRRSVDNRRKINNPDKYSAHTIKLEVVPGDYYTITVELYLSRIRYSYRFLKETRIVLSRQEVGRLYELAKTFIGNHCGINSDYPFERLYRCKPRIYFSTTQNRHAGKMLPYLKDQNGHAASVINGRLEGLFFSVNVHDAIDSSPFGEVLFEIKAFKLLNRKEHRVYFADFYCNSGTEAGRFDGPGAVPPHYITLVICKRDSPSDKFCAEHDLLEVDMTKPDSILRVRSDNRGARFSISGRNPVAWVEIFYTEPVEIEQGEDWKTLPVIGTGRSRHGGIKRVPNCPHCDGY